VLICLGYSVYNGNEELTKLLMEHGANPNIKKGGDPIIFTPILHNNLSIVKILVSGLGSTTDLDAVDSSGWTPLSQACSLGYLDIVKVLVETGNANVNAIEAEEKFSALQRACKEGHLSVVEYLLTRNIDIDYQDGSGCTVSLYRLPTSFSFDSFSIKQC